MAKGLVGIGGVPRNIKEGYVGMGGARRTLKSAYAGVGGVPRLCWSADKWANRLFAINYPDKYLFGEFNTETFAFSPMGNTPYEHFTYSRAGGGVQSWNAGYRDSNYDPRRAIIDMNTNAKILDKADTDYYGNENGEPRSRFNSYYIGRFWSNRAYVAVTDLSLNHLSPTTPTVTSGGDFYSTSNGKIIYCISTPYKGSGTYRFFKATSLTPGGSMPSIEITNWSEPIINLSTYVATDKAFFAGRDDPGYGIKKLNLSTGAIIATFIPPKGADVMSLFSCVSV